MQRVDKINKIAKLLALTNSSNDHEAISAFKMAKTIMDANKIHWCDLPKDAAFAGAAYKEPPVEPPIKRPVYEPPRYEPPRYSNDVSREPYEQLKRLAALITVPDLSPPIKDAEKILSLIHWFEKRGSFTEKQRGLVYMLIKINKVHL